MHFHREAQPVPHFRAAEKVCCIARALGYLITLTDDRYVVKMEAISQVCSNTFGRLARTVSLFCSPRGLIHRLAAGLRGEHVRKHSLATNKSGHKNPKTKLITHNTSQNIFECFAFGEIDLRSGACVRRQLASATTHHNVCVCATYVHFPAVHTGELFVLVDWQCNCDAR